MKTSSLGLLTTLVSVLTLLPACTTTPEGKNVPDVALMCSVAKNATYIGSSLYLKAKPQEREKFVLARDSLNTLIAAGTFSTADLAAALQKLPIHELEGDQGALIVAGAITLWDAYGRQLAQLDKAKVFDTYVLPVAKSILEGLDLALKSPVQ